MMPHARPLVTRRQVAASEVADNALVAALRAEAELQARHDVVAQLEEAGAFLAATHTALGRLADALRLK